MSRVGIDIGGTFTDFVFVEGGRLRVEKELSTPRDLSAAIKSGLAHVPTSEGFAFVSHGTTVGVNAILERRRTTTGLITTEGFRDVYEIGRHNRVDMYDFFYRKPSPLVPRHLRQEVRERLDARGNVLIPLEAGDVEKAARFFRSEGVESIAIVFLHAYANPEHERAAAEIVARVFPGAMLSLSHEIAREWREYERTSTTCANAYIMPLVAGYFERVEQVLARAGRRPPFFISKSSGGLMSVRAAAGRPVQTVMSGPAGGAVAAAFVGRCTGRENVIAFDMGGTSADVSLVHGGQLKTTFEGKIDRHPILVPMIEIATIGAGGGSIASVAPGGGLNVGPQSAGAEPGPAAYGRGGDEPTVTDANVVLGRLDPDHFLGGEMMVYPTLAAQAIAERVAEPLSLGVVEAADGIVTVVNAKMANAIRAVTIERGLDPRDFALLAFGGAGPLHAGALARELSISEVIVPPVPGALSALGMLVADLRYDFSRACVAPLARVEPAQLDAFLVEMGEEALAIFAADHIAATEVQFQASVDMRYVGQEHTLTIPLTGQVTAASIASVGADFDVAHERAYAHASTNEAKELVNVRLTAIAPVPIVELERLDEGGRDPEAAAVRAVRDVYFPETGFVQCRFYERSLLRSSNIIAGPAIVEEKGSTTLVPSGFMLRVGPTGTLHLSNGAQ